MLSLLKKGLCPITGDQRELPPELCWGASGWSASPVKPSIHFSFGMSGIKKGFGHFQINYEREIGCVREESPESFSTTALPMR